MLAARSAVEGDLDAARLWALIETGQVDGFVAVHSFTSLYYLYRRQGDQAGAYCVIRQILQVFHIAGINQSVIEAATALGWADFEDTVQVSAARRSGCDYIVTRNTQDYQEQPVPTMQLADFLAVWGAGLE